MEKNSLPIATPFSNSDFFHGLNDEQADVILRRGNLQRVEAGSVLFRQGDPATHSFFVTTGRLKLSKLHELGKEVLVRYIGAGEFTAMVAVLQGREYPVTGEAVTSAQVIRWEKQTMLGLMTEFPPIALNMIRNALDRLEELQSRYLELHAEQVEQRIARSLLRLMKQSGRRSGDEIIIDFPITRQELADYTGTTLYTVSRTLSAWDKKGWVKSSRERIVIVNPHALVLFSEN